MNDWIIWLAALAIGAAVLTWALHREFDRLDRERRYQLWLETSPALAKIKRDFEEFSRQVGEQMLPIMVRFTADMTTFAEGMRRAMGKIKDES